MFCSPPVHGLFLARLLRIIIINLLLLHVLLINNGVRLLLLILICIPEGVLRLIRISKRGRGGMETAMRVVHCLAAHTTTEKSTKKGVCLFSILSPSQSL